MDQEPFEFPPEMFGQVPLFAEIAKAMSWAGGPINWDMARQIATAMASSEHVPPIIDEDKSEMDEASRLAQSWLGEEAGFPVEEAGSHVLVATPPLWVEKAVTGYSELLEPLAGKLAGAFSADAPGAPDQMSAVVRQIMPLFLGIQCGSVLGALSRSLLNGNDVPFPVEGEGESLVLIAHIDSFARSNALDRRETRYWAALRASARRLLYEGFPWTRAHFWSLYHGYLAAIDVNLSETLERLQMLDITNPEQLQSAMGENLFGLGGTTSAGPAHERLFDFLALFEAAGDRAVRAAARGKLIGLSAIENAFAGSPAEGTRALEGFLGTQVPDDAARRAAAFCDVVLDRGGWAALNSIWEDTDKLPTRAELADPDSWFRRSG